NRDLALTPYKSIGELYLAGDGLARGYLNQAELTNQHFIEHTFSDGLNKRLYKTGDLVRYLADGNLAFVGRVDEQVKIRGFRIELGEIEAQLQTCDSIQSAVVVVHQAENREKKLIAYVLSTDATQMQTLDFTEKLNANLSKHLPDYMLPSLIIPVQDFPLTANGKIDKKALPSPEITVMEDKYTAPKGRIEIKLATIWSELLNIPVESISAKANFFELGGHSLLSIRLLAEIRAVLDKELSVKDIFEMPELYQLAKKIQQQDSFAKVTIAPINRDGVPLKTSFAQQRLWFIDQMDGGSAHYNMPSALRMHGNFKVEIAEAAFVAIIKRHESLRTVFIDADDGPLQVIKEQFNFRIKVTDLSNLTKDKQQQKIKQLVQLDAVKAFNLSTDLMLRVSYLQLSDEEGVLISNMHHIASDGWSIGILIHEFVSLYKTIQMGVKSDLPELPIQYADYAHWQRNWLEGEILEQQLDYWHKQLSGLPQVHNLPLDHKRPEFQSYNGAIQQVSLDKDILHALHNIALDNQVTFFMLLHAAFAILISRYSNSNDIVIGSPIANRTQKELEGLIGFFVNTLVLRSDCSG
ncbi:MAG TPA: non-ribosomal peptide synthetase, partial [Oceanospirillales bacterium]|nr:non-ribosomal peptide synthetase [Oceanospirillales bacterium]